MKLKTVIIMLIIGLLILLYDMLDERLSQGLFKISTAEDKEESNYNKIGKRK
jgi:surface polysaccharide O-acyltransferase-like enzyme